MHGFKALKWDESVANYLHITRKDNEKGTMNTLFPRLNLVMINVIYHNTYYINSVKSLTNENENAK